MNHVTIAVLLICAVGILLLVRDLAPDLKKAKAPPPREEKIAVYFCSPYRGPDMPMNIDFARRCCREIQFAGAAVFAPHLHTPQFLNDEVSEERNMGIDSGLEIMSRFDEVWFVLPAWRKDFSTGMGAEHPAAHEMDKRCIVVRTEEAFKQQLVFLKKRVSDHRGTVRR